MTNGDRNNLIVSILSLVAAVIVVIIIDIFVYPSVPGITGVVTRSWSIRNALIGLAVTVGGVLALFFIIVRAESRARWLSEARTRIFDPILRSLLGNKPCARILSDWLDLRSKTLSHQLPLELKKMRFELYTLMNMMLRHEIHRVKAGVSHGLVGKLAKMEKRLAERIPTAKDINENLRTHIEGGVIRRVNECAWEIAPGPGYEGGRIVNNVTGIGFGRQYYIVYKVMEELGKLFSEDMTRKPPDTPEDEVNKFASDKEAEILDPAYNQIMNTYGQYKAALNRFRAFNFVRAHMIYFMDMYNMYGRYRRGYWFAKPGAVPDLYNYKIVSDDGIIRRVTLTEKRNQGEPATEEPHSHGLYLELDVYNRCLSDMNAIEVERIDLQSIRKFKKKDVVYLHKGKTEPFPRYWNIADFGEKDWNFFIEDLEKGDLHPYSRRLADYTELIAEGRMDFQNATFKRPLVLDEVAFDYESLKNPGNQIYWGRKHYFMEERTDVLASPQNPYPTHSLLGLWGFISSVALKRIDESELAREYLDYFKMNYEPIEKVSGERGGAKGGHH